MGRFEWCALGWAWLVLPLWVVLGHRGSALAAEGEAAVGRVGAHLSVEPGATCLDAQQLAAQVALWLDEAPLARDVLIEVVGSTSDARNVRLHVVRDGRTVAHRVFEPAPLRCSHMHAAVGLAIALTFKASLVEDLGRPLPDDPSAREWGWSLAAFGVVSDRLLPELAPGFELSARRTLGDAFLLRFGALGVTASGLPLTQAAGSFDGSLALARTDACVRASLATGLRAAACVGLLGGVLHVAGADVASPTRANVPLLSLANGVELELELSRHWSLALGVSMTFLLHRVRVGLEDGSGQRTASRVLPRSGLAVGIGPAYAF